MPKFSEVYTQFSEVYKKGLAVGQSDIRTDEMNFRFRDELFTFPLLIVHPFMTFNGYFYTAEVMKLRTLKKKSEAI